jgi:cytochrome bd ubiquinol oxidase subunit II
MDLEILWFVIVAFFWSGYFLLEGFDFGVGMLLPFVPKSEAERGVLLRSIGPVWDGNEVWLVVAGAATFAAFPAWYASMFSGFYIAFLLVLFFLIIRVLSFEWRAKSTSPRWRSVWLWANSVGSYGASLIWGVGLANLLYGVPLDENGDFTGTFWDLFSVYTVLAGVTAVAVFAFHGATFLTLRTTGALLDRVGRAARLLSFPAVVLGAAFFVTTVVVAMQRNDKDLFPPVIPAALGIAALVVAALLVGERQAWPFAMTALSAVLVVATLFTSLYPRVMVSDPSFGNSLTVENASSAHYALAVMSVVALMAVPGILLYQAWTYRVFRHRIGADAPGEEAVPELSTQPEV